MSETSRSTMKVFLASQVARKFVLLIFYIMDGSGHPNKRKDRGPLYWKLHDELDILKTRRYLPDEL